MTSYTNPFTGQTISPSASSYSYIAITTPDTVYLQWPINGTEGAVIASDIIELDAYDYSNNPAYVVLPPATQVSVGQSILACNKGVREILFNDDNGMSVASLKPGEAKYLYTISNTTTYGAWREVVLGVGASAISAGALTYPNLYGVQAIGTYLGQQYPVTTYFSDAALSYLDRARLANWGSGAGTFTLPPASDASIGYGWFCMIRNSGTGILTVQPDGANTIDGESTLQLQLGESLTIVSDGSNWITFGIGRSNEFAYTQLSLFVTGGTLILSAVQAANTIQQYSGALTSNQIIRVPPTVQLYSVTNSTTGAYTLTVNTGVVGGAAVEVTQGTSLILICDGTNIYNAASGGASSTINTLILGPGSAAVPSLQFGGSPTTGLFLPNSGALGIAILGAYRAYFDAYGLTVNGTVTALSGISGGTF